MKTYVGDEAAATGHLTAEEFGAYERLRRHYWRHGSIPEDATTLMRITHVHADDWSLLWPMIAPLLDLDRLDDMRADAAEKRERKIQAGRMGAAKRWGNRGVDGNRNGNANGKAMTQPIADPMRTQWPPAPAPDSQKATELEVKSLRTDARENWDAFMAGLNHGPAPDSLIPAPATETEAKAILDAAKVFPADYAKLLQKLMGGELRSSEL